MMENSVERRLEASVNPTTADADEADNGTAKSATEASAQSRVTARQLERMERNRLKAIQLRESRIVNAARLETEGPAESKSGASATVAVVAPRPSRPMDTRAGFIPPEYDDDFDANDEAHKPPVVVEEELPEMGREHFRCESCNQRFYDSLLSSKYRVLVCTSCYEAGREGKYAFVTKSEAKTDYLLNDDDLDGGENSLAFILRKNPRNPHWNEMRLYLRCQVEDRSFSRWGGEDGLDQEIDRREAERAATKKRKHEAKIKLLRRNVRTSTWMKDKEDHRHVFTTEEFDEATGKGVRTCDCGHEVEFERI